MPYSPEEVGEPPRPLGLGSSPQGSQVGGKTSTTSVPPHSKLKALQLATGLQLL